MTPFLLDSSRYRHAVRLNLMSVKIKCHAGELARALMAAEPDAVRTFELQMHSAEQHPEWRKAIARELLLLDPDTRGRWIRSIPWIADIRPFGTSGPLIRDIECKRCAMVHYPLAGRSGDKPDLGLVAVVEHDPKSYRVEPSDAVIDGNSWELAGALARHFAAQGNQADIVDLASRWIVTGKMNGSQVNAIDMGNKMELYTEYPERSWIVPVANARNEKLTRPGGAQILPAHDLDDAIAHVRGMGISRGMDLTEWPESDEIHSFVSDALPPVLMAALFMARGKFILWRSSTKYSRETQWLEHIIRNRLNKNVEVKEDFAPSHDLAAAERVLLRHLEPLLSEGKRILFNITQGNMIMRSAPLLIARRFPGLRLVYRNADIKDRPEFEMIQFPFNKEVVTSSINMAGTPANANWSRLLGVERVNFASWNACADYYFPEKPAAYHFIQT